MIEFSIDFCNDDKQIIHVWKSVFGDSDEDILFFLNQCKQKKCLGVFVDNQLVSMLFMIDCIYGGLNGKYIYAVSTLEDYRGNGFAGMLVEKAKEYAQDFLWLIPAEESLIGFYEKLGFDIKLYSDCDYLNRIVFHQIHEIVEYLYEGCELKQPVGMVWANTDFPVGNIGLNKE